MSVSLPRSLLLCLSLAGAAMAAGAPLLPTPAATPAAAKKTGELKRGDMVKILRTQTLMFYGKPWGTATAGTVMEVLDVRPATRQVFLAAKDAGRVIAVSVPLDSVRSEQQEKLLKKAERVELSTALFAGLIPKLNLRIPPEQMEKLRKEPRQYVEVSVEEAGTGAHEHLGLKLKGSAGSFQTIDQRPGFSLNCTKFDGGERFHGLRRFQLNNCAQDGTALNELVSGAMARAAGVPASRCTHALVSLNGRDLGIYVLKEGFTEEFLAEFFKRPDGHLYDGGFVADIRQEMELDRGDPASQEGLPKLLDALHEPDAGKQWTKLQAIVDIDAYLRYLALEAIMCHWDGYSYNKNNYRLYENPENGRFQFILHGMDQMFADTKQSLLRPPQAQVGAIVWRHPEMRERYWTILQDVYTRVIKNTNWPARVQEDGRRLQVALSSDQARDYRPKIAEESDKVAARLKEVRRQLDAPRLEPMLAAKGAAELKTGAWEKQVENAEGDEVEEDRHGCLHLKATGNANASWRLSLIVPAGKFRFTARMKTKGLEPLTAETGDGAGLRLSGGSRQGQKSLKGNAPWQYLTYDFESTGKEVTLVAEMRATAGELWIERESLRLSRTP